MNRTSFMVVAILLAVAVVVVNAKSEDMFLKLVRQRACREGLCRGNYDKKDNILDTLRENTKKRRCTSFRCTMKRAQSGIDGLDWESVEKDDDIKTRFNTKRAYKPRRCISWNCGRSIPSKREMKKTVDITRNSVTDTQHQKKNCISWDCRNGKRFFGVLKNSVVRDNDKRNVHDVDSSQKRKSLSDTLKKQRDSHYKCLSWDCDKRRADGLPVSESDLSADKKTTEISRSMEDEPNRRFRAFLMKQRPPIRNRAWQYPGN